MKTANQEKLEQMKKSMERYKSLIANNDQAKSIKTALNPQGEHDAMKLDYDES